MDSVSIFVRAGVSSVDGDVLEYDVCAVLKVDGGIGIQVLGVWRVYPQFADLQIVDAVDGEAVCLGCGGGVAGDGQVSDGFQDIVSEMCAGFQNG